MSVSDSKQILNIRDPTLVEIKLAQKSCCFNCNIKKLPLSVFEYIEEKAKICQPSSIHVCDGSEEEYKGLLKILEEQGSIKRLENNKFDSKNLLNFFILRILRFD